MRRKIDLQTTVVFQQNYEAFFNSNKRFIINEGSSRSSKTISICQLLIVYALKTPNKTIGIVRKTLKSLRGTAMKDFINQLKDLNIYKESSHNKSECIYNFDNGTTVEFFGADDSQKLRGKESDVTWCNEANELWYEDFSQLNLRCKFKMIFDYNPSDSQSFLYDLAAEDSILIKSTFRDNPFVAKEIVKQIEAYKETDPELYQIFGLGLRITPRQNVYAGWEFIEGKPERFTQYLFGVDFGFNHPTALIKIWYYENELYLEEMIYESYLTGDDIVEKVNGLTINKDIPIIAETARPEINEQLSREGYYIIKGDKTIKNGINAVKTYKIYVDNKAKHIRKEFENYKWMKKGEIVTDEPIKLYDDAMDAIRYATLFIKNNRSVDTSGPEFFSLEY